MASATSKKTELKLTGVARASLEELLLDYEDFLRQHGLRIWPKDSPEALVLPKNCTELDLQQEKRNGRKTSNSSLPTPIAKPLALAWSHHRARLTFACFFCCG